MDWKIACAFATICLVGYSESKTYELKVLQFYLSADTQPGWMDLGTLRISRKSKSAYVITGTVYLFRNIGNSETTNYEIYQKNKVEETFSRKLLSGGPKPFCEVLQSDKDIYPQMRGASNLPPQDACPYPKGNYTIKDFELKDENLPDFLPPGDYRLNVIYHTGKEYLGTLVIIVAIR